MLKICKEEIKDITFFEISKMEMENVRKFLKPRFDKGKTLPGTKSFHHFISISTSNITYKITCNEESIQGSFDLFNDESLKLDITKFTVSKFVSCHYDTFWWIGMIQNVDDEARDLEIKFLHPHGPSKNFYWPSKDNICYVPVTNILCLLSPPSTSTGRTYNILDNDYENNVRAFNGTKGDLTCL